MNTPPHGCLFLVKLNRTSFYTNPGKLDLPKGKYVMEVRGGVFSYRSGHSVDVEVTYNGNKRNRKRIPNIGRFKDREYAINLYQGAIVEFSHDGGPIEIYNPSLSNSCTGSCDVAIWNSDHFGMVDKKNFNTLKYGNNNGDRILILTDKPELKQYDTIKNVSWQSDTSNISKYKCLILPNESFSFLHLIRDNCNLGDYIRSGGRVYLVGAAPMYLSYINFVPQLVDEYMGGGEYTAISVDSGAVIQNNGGSDVMVFDFPIALPVVNIDENSHSYLIQNSKKTWCTMRRFSSGKGKIVWSSHFLVDYDNSENWNNFVLDQIDWLLQ